MPPQEDWKSHILMEKISLHEGGGHSNHSVSSTSESDEHVKLFSLLQSQVFACPAS